jgi:hypothetical protein
LGDRTGLTGLQSGAGVPTARGTAVAVALKRVAGAVSVSTATERASMHAEERTAADSDSISQNKFEKTRGER